MSLTKNDSTIGELVVERPSRARILEQLGIDYCCGGKLPFHEACQSRGLDPAVVRSAIEHHDHECAGQDGPDWSHAPLTELANHIEATHHQYLRSELPRLAMLFEKVDRAHGDRHPHMRICREIYSSFRSELESHMMKEEHVLFPMIRFIDGTSQAPACHCGSISDPIRVMESEHDSAGDALATMRELTSGFAPPADACNTYRVLLDGLAELERDMHQHVHKENNILFPRALRRERDITRVPLSN